MLRIFYGPDTHSRAKAVRQLKQELDSDGMLSANTVTLEGARLVLAELIATCDTVPFLADHRLVIVTDLLARAQAQPATGGRARAAAGATARTAAAPAFAELIEYVPRLPATTTLLLLDGALREDNSLLQSLRPYGEIQKFPELSPDQTADWVRRRAQSLGASFEPAAVRALVSLVDKNLWTLSGEVDKLALYATGRAVTEDDVRRLVFAAQTSNIFAMVDAILDRRLDLALRQLQLLLQGGAAGPYLITMIARQFRQLILVQDLAHEGAPPAAIMRAAEIRSDPALRRLRQQAQRWNPARLQAAYERILAADLSIKRGQADEDTALELLVAELAGW